jgi:hypothetical protein
MSDASDLSAGLLNAMDGEQGGDAAPVSDGSGQPSAGGTAPTQGYDTSGLSPYATNWLNSLPDPDRPKAAEYVRSWDKGFQNYSQQLRQQYQPYEQLGSPQDLQQLKEAFEYIRTNPTGFVQTLIERGLYQPDQGQKQQGGAQSAPTLYDVNGNPVEVPQPKSYDPEIKRLESALGGLAQTIQQQQSAREAAEADRALDQLTAQLHEKHGSFNEMFVWQLLAQGMDGDMAVQMWKNEVQQATQQQNQPRRVMGASSAPPLLPGPLNSSEDRATALANWLKQSQ